MKYIAVMAFAVLPLSACLAEEEPRAEAQADACGAAEYDAFVGTDVEALTLPTDRVVRVMREGQPATMDFLENRLNIVTDDDGLILQVSCG